jgi:hypothetical protein
VEEEEEADSMDAEEEEHASALVERLIQRVSTAEPYRFTNGGAVRRMLASEQGGGNGSDAANGGGGAGELEKTFTAPAYQTVVLYRGEQSTSKRMNQYRSVGLLKCRVRVIRCGPNGSAPMDGGGGGAGDGGGGVGTAGDEAGASAESVFDKQDVVVRLYVLDAPRVQLESTWSMHHPYLTVSLEGKHKQSTRDHHLTLHKNENASSLPFFQVFSLPATLPGPSQLQVRLTHRNKPQHIYPAVVPQHQPRNMPYYWA